MRKFNLVKLSILKILLIGGIVVLTFSCTTDIEPPPPLSNELSSSSSDSPDAPSSSGVESSSSAVQSSSSAISSSSSVAPSSSSVNSSSSSETLSSSSSSIQSSSSVVPSSSSFVSGPCAGFVEGTTRLHYGQNKPQFCDERDGKKYVYVEIGTQTWMAENLNYNADGSRCYGDNTGGDSQNRCGTYGRLYNWATAMNLNSSCNSSNCASQVQSKHQGICPNGWHIPHDAKWTTLTNYVESQGGCSDCAGTRLKAASGWGWSDGNGTGDGISGGTDNHGFSALPGGYGNSDDDFNNVNYLGRWWSSSEFFEYVNVSAYNRDMNASSGLASYVSRNTTLKTNLFSVRCVQDN